MPAVPVTTLSKVATWVSVTLAKSYVNADGGSVSTFPNNFGGTGGGGSGGGISLWGGGGVFFTGGTLSARGGSVSSSSDLLTSPVNGYGGGGGYVVVGYGPNALEPSLSSVFVAGGMHSGKGTGGSGSDGVKRTVRFEGF